MEQLKETREHTEQEHTRILGEIKAKAEAKKGEADTQILDWFNKQVAGLHPAKDSEEDKAQREKVRAIQDLRAQQDEISKKLAELEGRQEPPRAQETEEAQPNQEVLLQQLKLALAGKKEEDPNKALLKALITDQNKTPGEGGTNTLKTSILNGLLTPEAPTTWQNGWRTSINRGKVSPI